MSENISKLSGRKGLKDNLFKRLTTISGQSRIPGKAEMENISEDFKIGKSTIYGSATFYEFLTEEHLEKKAYVCNGSACLCAGTQAAVRTRLEESFGKSKVGNICCLGRCHEGSAFHIDGLNYSGKAIDELDNIKNKKRPPDSGKTAGDDYRVSSSSTMNILTDDSFSNIESCKVCLKNLTQAKDTDILDEIKISGLRGRGGAGFPTGIKWESCRNTESDEKFVVCNADEGDPGAYSDRYLLEKQPNRVVLGMIICGYLTGAKEGVLYIRGEYPDSISIINKTLEEFRDNGLLGENILGTDFSFKLLVIEGAGAYICGEETALIASIEGRRGEVDVRPPFPTVEGLFKKPTVVNNVETFAATPTLLKRGGKLYSELGSGRSTGTKLLSLDAGFNKPGIYEVEFGTSLDTVINTLGEGFKYPVKALHIGGPLGGLVPVEKITDLNVDYESFTDNGFLLGHGSIVCLPESMAVIDYIEHLFEFTAAESCGKCFPCRLGSTRGKEMMEQAKSGKQKIDPGLLTDLLDALERGSLCALGGGLPLPVKNALVYFSDELAPYFSNKIELTNLN